MPSGAREILPVTLIGDFLVAFRLWGSVGLTILGLVLPDMRAVAHVASIEGRGSGIPSSRTDLPR